MFLELGDVRGFPGLGLGEYEGGLDLRDLLDDLRVRWFCHELLRFRPVTAKRRKAPAGMELRQGLVRGGRREG
ncbi:hypothetical protein GCM10010272_36520 [Streptomyces lateritius]|nr:hypothetical protein GCM10010272_36520 [Streptomyces lateritius]